MKSSSASCKGMCKLKIVQIGRKTNKQLLNSINFARWLSILLDAKLIFCLYLNYLIIIVIKKILHFVFLILIYMYFNVIVFN